MRVKKANWFTLTDGAIQFRKVMAELNSGRKVRPVVIPSGKRGRGKFPSIKAVGEVNYESQLELNALRVLEVASGPIRIVTHPFVLELSGNKRLRYTPDVLVELADGGYLIEIKATYFLTDPKARNRLLEQVQRLSKQGIQLVIITEQDLVEGALIEEIRDLLRNRVSVGRRRSGIDASAWNPLIKDEGLDPLNERRWRDAQQECDALLTRLMKRDPGDYIATFNQ